MRALRWARGCYAADADHWHDGRYGSLRRDHPAHHAGGGRAAELDFTPASDSVHLVDMCGPGYAIPSAEGNAAIRMMAENEGLFLDPVYTGKAFAGVIKLAREGKFRPRTTSSSSIPAARAACSQSTWIWTEQRKFIHQYRARQAARAGKTGGRQIWQIVQL